MASKDSMLPVLSRLALMVDHQAYEQAEQIVNDCGLELIISEEFIDFCRWMKNPSVVIFASTLAVYNAKLVQRPQMILQVYQSIINKELTPDMERLPKNHVIRHTVACMIAKQPVVPPAIKGNGFTGTGQDWFMALEICMDHQEMDSALNLMQAELRRDKSNMFALLCAKAFVERAPIIINTQNAHTPWTGWIRLQQEIYQVLTRAGMAKIVHDLAQLIGEFHHKNRAYEDCIAWSSKPVPPGSNQVIPWFRVAQAHCHLGAHDQAAALLDKVLHKVSRQSDAEIDGEFLNSDVSGAKSAAMEFNSGDAARALKDLQDVLAPGGIVPFLVSGTLLGFQRNGGFLPHDKDIDVGIFANQDIFTVVELISQSKNFRLSTGYLRLEKTYQLPVVHKLTGMCIDIFIYYPSGGKLVTGVHGTFGYNQNFAFSPFGIKTVEFLDVDFAVPDDIARNLAENYGNWQVSDPYYVTHLESPSTVDQGGPIYMLVTRLEMIRAIIEGKHAKVERIAGILRKYQAAPFAMDAGLIEALDARFGAGRAALGRHASADAALACAA